MIFSKNFFRHSLDSPTSMSYVLIKPFKADNAQEKKKSFKTAPLQAFIRRIYHLSGCRKPVERLWISSMTDEAIKQGFASL